MKKNFKLLRSLFLMMIVFFAGVPYLAVSDPKPADVSMFTNSLGIVITLLALFNASLAVAMPGMIAKSNPNAEDAKTQGFVLRLALFESCAIFGIVLGILMESPQVGLPFSTLAFLGILLSPIKGK